MKPGSEGRRGRLQSYSQMALLSLLTLFPCPGRVVASHLLPCPVASLPHSRSPTGPCPELSLVAPQAPHAPPHPQSLASPYSLLECELGDLGS